MISIGRISDAGTRFDENWLVVRSLKNGVPSSAKQVASLSPSKDLFYRYLDVKKAGKFDQGWFQSEYIPVFLREIKDNREARTLLNRLCQVSVSKDILLACFCPDEALCHRSILAGLLLGAGAKIKCSNEYAQYFRMYRDMSSGVI